MTWNYRVVKRRHVGKDLLGRDYVTYTYGIHEAYYDEKGKVCSITENPVDAFGESREELERDLKRHLKALKLPTIDYDTIRGCNCEEDFKDVTKEIEYKSGSKKKKNKKT